MVHGTIVSVVHQYIQYVCGYLLLLYRYRYFFSCTTAAVKRKKEKGKKGDFLCVMCYIPVRVDTQQPRAAYASIAQTTTIIRTHILYSFIGVYRTVVYQYSV